VDNTLQLRARGSMGHVNMEGNETILPQAALEIAQRISNVARVEHYLLAMTPTEGHNFAMIVGVNPGETKRLESHGEAGNPRIIAGRDLAETDRSQRVAVIGQGVARWARITPENLANATLTLDLKRTHPVIFALDRPPATLSIVGMYASGYVFGDMQLFMPIDTFREVYGVRNGISWLFVHADSADHLAEVEQALRRGLGRVADIIAPTSAAEFERTTTRAVRRFAAVGSALAAVLMVTVVFFVTLLNVRDRTREIGTLKALGASDRGVAASFLVEALVLAALGAALGAAIFAALGGLTAGGFFGVAVSPFLPAHYKDALKGVLSTTAGFGASSAGWLMLTTLFAACAGSAWSLRQIVKLSPVEAIRHE
jgi:ABC-type antimicrobial peptide transport system permease subunit